MPRSLLIEPLEVRMMLDGNPSLQLGDPLQLDEGAYWERIGTICDGGGRTFTGTVDYGDGTGTQDLYIDSQSQAVSLGHTFVDNSTGITVCLYENGMLTATETLSASVQNVAPTVTGPYDQQFTSNYVSFTDIAAINDPGVADTFNYTIDWGDGQSDSGSTSNQGSLSGSHQYSDWSTHYVSVTVYDDDGAWGTHGFQVSLSQPPDDPPDDPPDPPANSAPSDLALSNNSVLPYHEYTYIGTFSTTDSDSGDTFTYSLSGNDAWAFYLQGDSLYSNSLSSGSYQIQVTTTDSASNSYSEWFTINVGDPPANMPPTGLSLSNNTVPANQPGAYVGTFSTTDPDSGDTFWYSVTGGSTTDFYVQGADLYVAGNVSAGNYSLLVATVDSASNSYSDWFTINVVAPAIEISGADTVWEGTNAQLSASLIGSSSPIEWDLDNDGIYGEAAWHCVDESTGTYDGGLRGYEQGSAVTLDAIGLPAGTSVTVWARTTDGTLCASRTITVQNVAPTSRPGGPYYVTQGSTITLDGYASSDPGGVLTEYRWSWQLPGQSLPTEQFGRQVSFDAVGIDEPCVVQVGLTVHDPSGGQHTVWTTVNVLNAAPLVTVGGPFQAETIPAVVTRRVTISDYGNDAWTAEVKYWASDSWHPLEVHTEGDVHYVDLTCTYTEFGTYQVTVRATDSHQGVATGSFEVQLGNIAPTARIDGPTEVTEGQSITLSGAGSTDPGGNIVSYLWDLDNDGNFGENAAERGATVQFAAPPSLVSSYYVPVRLRVTDATDLSGTTTVWIRLNNLAPIADAGGPYRAYQGWTLQLNASASQGAVGYLWDLDGDGIFGEEHRHIVPESTIYGYDEWGNYVVVSQVPEHEEGTGDRGDEWGVTPQFSTAGLGPGVYNVTVVAYDSEGQASDPTTVTVVVMWFSGPQDGAEGQVLCWTGMVNDNDSHPWTGWVTYGDASQGEPVIVAANGSFQFSHAYGNEGQYTVTLTVSDDGYLQQTSVTTVTIANVAPQISAPEQYKMRLGDTLDLGSVVHFTDPGFLNSFYYQVIWGDGSSDSGTPTTWIPAGEQAVRGLVPTSHTYASYGDYVVTLFVYDSGTNNEARRDFTVRVLDPDAPWAHAGGAYVVSEGESVQLSAALSSGGNGQVVDYLWDLDGDGIYGEAPFEGGGLRGDERGANPTFFATGLSATTTWTVGLQVSNNLGRWDTDTATISVVPPPNHAPQGADKTVTTAEDAAYTFTVADFGFSDPNDTPANALAAVKITTLPSAGSLTLNGVAVTAGQVIDVDAINDHLLVFTPVANANGTSYASFTFQVQDDGGTAYGGQDLDPSPNTIALAVTPPPIVTNAGPFAEGTPVSLHANSIYDGEVDYLWAVFKGTATSSYTTGVGQEWDFTPDDDGTYRIVLTVNADSGSSTFDHNIVVQNVAPKATIVALPIWAHPAVGKVVSLQGFGVAAEGTTDSLAYTWRVYKGSSTTVFAEGGNSEDFAFTPNEAGDYRVVFTVSDDDSSSSSTEYTVAVAASPYPSVTLTPTSISTTINSSVVIGGTCLGVDSSSNAIIVDYGDQTPLGTAPIDAAHQFAVQHSYATAGEYLVVVSVGNAEQGYVSSTMQVHVGLPTATIALGDEDTVDQGTAWTRSCSFTQELATSWTAVVDYGDKTGLQTLAVGATKTFTLSHTYRSAGAHTLTVWLTDNLGTTSSQLLAVNVTDVAPTPSIAWVGAGATGTYTVDEGDICVLSLSATDPGDDPIKWTVDWGDGSTAQLANGRAIYLAHKYTSTGTHSVTASATGGAASPASDTISITVNALPADMEIRDEGLDTLVDGDDVSLPDATQGMPVRRTFTIVNHGQGTLLLSDFSLTAGSGYSFVGASQTSVSVAAFGGQATFVVQCDAASVGTREAILSFTSNDVDATTFSIDLSTAVSADTGDLVVTGLRLANDPLLGTTSNGGRGCYDPAVTGVIRGDYGTNTVRIDFDHDSDDTADGSVVVPVGARQFTYNPLSTSPDLTGDIPLRYRLVVLTGGTETPGDWFEYHLHRYDDPATGTLRVEGFGLVKPGNSTAPTTTNNPVVTGVVAGDFSGGTVQVQFDHDNDESTDAAVTIATAGSHFAYDPRSYITDFPATGAISFQYRVAKLDGTGQVLNASTWTSFGYTLTAAPAATLSIASFGLADDTEDGGSTSDPKVAGAVSGLTQGTATVQFDLDDDGLPDASVTTDASGEFTWSPTGLPLGETTILARTVEWNDTEKMYVFGDWSSCSFTLTSKPVPPIATLTFNPPSDATQATLTGTIDGDATAGLIVEIDLNGDNTAEASTAVESDGSFTCRLTGIGTTERTARARVKRLNADNTSTQSDWSDPIPFTYAPVATPDIATLTLQHPLDTAATTTRDPGLTGTLSGTTGVAGVKVLFDWNDDDVADGSTITNAAGEFTFRPNRLASGSVTITAWTSRFDVTAGQDIKSANTFDLSFTYQPIEAPAVAALSLVSITGSPDGQNRPRTSQVAVQGSLASGGAVRNVRIEFALEDSSGDYQHNGCTLTDDQGNFTYLPTGLTAGLVKLRAQSIVWDTTASAELAGAWQSLDFNYVATPAATVSSLHLVRYTPAVAPDTLPTAADPTLAGELAGEAGANAFVRFERLVDLATDTWELNGYCQSDADGKFTFRVGSLTAADDVVTIRAMAVTRDPNYGTEVLGTPFECSFHYAPTTTVVSPATVSLALQSGFNDASARTTTDATLTGTVTGIDAPGYAIVQFDLDNDGQSDCQVMADANGSYVARPASIAVGAVSVRARVKHWDDDLADDVYGSWSTAFAFTLQAAATTPTITSFALRSPSPDNTTCATNTLLVGQLGGRFDLAGLAVQSSLDGGTSFTSTVAPDASGFFRFEPKYLAYGPVSVLARVVWWNETSGAMQTGPSATVTFQYRASTGAPPTVGSLGLQTNLNPNGTTPVATSPVLLGTVQSEHALAGVLVDLDLDNNGVYETTVLCDDLGVFGFSPTNLPYGSVTIAARPRELDAATGQLRVGAAAQFSFEHHAAPTLSGLSLFDITENPVADRVTTNATLVGVVSDSEALAGAVLSVEVDPQTSGGTLGTANVDSQGHFTFLPTGLHTGAVSLRVRAVKAITGGVTLYGDWQNISFAFAPNSTTAATLHGTQSASGVYDTAVGNAGDLRAQALREAEALFAAVKKQADSAYAAAVTTAYQDFLANLASYQATDKTTGNPLVLSWPTAPNGNSAVIPDDSTYTLSAAQTPNYGGPEFDPERDPLYRSAVAQARYVYSNALSAAENAYRLATTAAENALAIDDDLTKARQAYEKALTSAQQDYDDAVCEISVPNDPSQAEAAYQAARSSALAAYDTACAGFAQDHSASCQQLEIDKRAAWNQVYSEYKDQTEINRKTKTQEAERILADNAAWRDFLKAEADLDRTFAQERNELDETFENDRAEAWKDAQGTIAEAFFLYRQKLAANDRAIAEGVADAQQQLELDIAAADQTLAEAAADAVLRRDSLIADAGQESRDSIIGARVALEVALAQAKKSAADRWADRQIPAWGAYQQQLAANELAYHLAIKTYYDSNAQGEGVDDPYHVEEDTRAIARRNEEYAHAAAEHDRAASRAEASGDLRRQEAALVETKANSDVDAYATYEKDLLAADYAMRIALNAADRANGDESAEIIYVAAAATADAAYDYSLSDQVDPESYSRYRAVLDQIEADASNGQTKCIDQWLLARTRSWAQHGQDFAIDATAHQKALSDNREDFLSNLANAEEAFESSGDLDDGEQGLAEADYLYAGAVADAAATRATADAEAAFNREIALAAFNRGYANAEALANAELARDNAQAHVTFQIGVATACRAAWNTATVNPWTTYQKKLADAEVARVTALGYAEYHVAGGVHGGYAQSVYLADTEYAPAVNQAEYTIACDAAAAARDLVVGQAGQDGTADADREAAEALAEAGLDYAAAAAAAATAHDQAVALAAQAYDDAMVTHYYALANAEIQATLDHEESLNALGRRFNGDTSSAEYRDALAQIDSTFDEAMAKATAQHTIDVAADRQDWIETLAAEHTTWVNAVADATDIRADAVYTAIDSLADQRALLVIACATTVAEAVYQQTLVVAGASNVRNLALAGAQRTFNLDSTDASGVYQLAATNARSDYAIALYQQHATAVHAAVTAQTTSLLVYQAAVADADLAWATQTLKPAAAAYQASLNAAEHDRVVAVNIATQAQAAGRYGARQYQAQYDDAQALATKTWSIAADTAEANRQAAVAIAQADAQAASAKAHAEHQRLLAAAAEAYQHQCLDAEYAYAQAVATAQEKYPSGNGTYSDDLSAAEDILTDDREQAAIDYANRVAEAKVTLAHDEGELQIDQVFYRNYAEVAHRQDLAQAAADFSHASSDAEVRLATRTAQADRTLTVAQARAQAGYVGRQGIAEANYQSYLRSGDYSSVDYASALAQAEVTYQSAGLQQEASTAAIWAARAEATTLDRIEAAQAAARATWFGTVGADYVTYRAALANAADGQQYDRALAQAAAANRQASADVAYAVASAALTADYQSRSAAVDQGNSLGATAIDSAYELARAQATAARELAYAQAAAEKLAALTQAEADYAVAAASAPSGYVEPGSPEDIAHQAAVAQAERSEKLALAAADRDWQKAVAAADQAYESRLAALDWQRAQAEAELSAEQSVATTSFAAARSLAYADAQTLLWTRSTTVDNTYQTRAAQAEAAFITAQRGAETSVATTMATSLDLAWATFQQHYSQAKQTWWQDHQADYLASVTSANQASSAYQTAVNTAYLIQAVAQADADTLHATDTAGDAKLEEEARAEAACIYRQAQASANTAYLAAMASAAAVFQQAVAEADYQLALDPYYDHYGAVQTAQSARDVAEQAAKNGFNLAMGQAETARQAKLTQAEGHAADQHGHDQVWITARSEAQRDYTQTESDYYWDLAIDLATADNDWQAIAAAGPGVQGAIDDTPWGALASALAQAEQARSATLGTADLTRQTSVANAQKVYASAVAAADAVYAQASDVTVAVTSPAGTVTPPALATLPVVEPGQTPTGSDASFTAPAVADGDYHSLVTAAPVGDPGYLWYYQTMYVGFYSDWLPIADLPYANHAGQAILRPTSTADETRLPAAAPQTIDKKVLPGGDVQINTYDPSTGQFSSSIVPNVGAEKVVRTWSDYAVALRQSIIRYDDNAIGFNGQLNWLRDFQPSNRITWDATVIAELSIGTKSAIDGLPTRDSLRSYIVAGQSFPEYAKYSDAVNAANTTVKSLPAFLAATKVTGDNGKSLYVLGSDYVARGSAKFVELKLEGQSQSLRPDGAGALLEFALDPATIRENVFAFLVRANTLVQQDIHNAVTALNAGRNPIIEGIESRWVKNVRDRFFLPNVPARLGALQRNQHATSDQGRGELRSLEDRLTTLRDDFNTIQARLLRHEQGHFDIAELYRRALVSELQTLRVFMYVPVDLPPGGLSTATELAEEKLQELAASRARDVADYMRSCNEYYDSQQQASHNRQRAAQDRWNNNLAALLNIGIPDQPANLRLNDLL